MSKRKQYEIVVSCSMLVRVAVEARSEAEIREWIESADGTVLSVIETPTHEASEVSLVSVLENNALGFCADIVLPVVPEAQG